MGPGWNNVPAASAASAAPAVHATGRHRRDSSRPVGNSSSTKVNSSPNDSVKPRSPKAIRMSPAGTRSGSAARVVAASLLPNTERLRHKPIAQHSHPMTLPGRRETITAPTVANTRNGIVSTTEAAFSAAGKAWLGRVNSRKATISSAAASRHRPQATQGASDEPVSLRRGGLRATVTPRLLPADHPCRCSCSVVAAFSQSLDHDRPEIVTDKPYLIPAGGEQAANTLQPADSSRYATTPNAKISGAVEGLPLVVKWRCLRSHGSYQRRPCDTLPHCSLRRHP